MYVRNVAGYNFAFKYRDAVIYIPSDGKIYSVPDDSGTYKELKVIPPMHIRTQSVQYINKDGSAASEKISGHKRRGRPVKQVNPDKPLLGVRIKKQELINPKPKDVAPKEIIPTPPKEDSDNSIMTIDLTDEVSTTDELKTVSTKKSKNNKTSK